MRGICLVGCGRIAAMHARDLAGKADLFFYDPSPDSARRLAAAHGGEVIPTWEGVLRRPDVEALFVCSPPEFHCDQVVAGLAAGKSVLVEKPMCVCRDEIDRIAAAAEAAPSGRLMVAENYYYKPVARLLGGILREGLIGAPELIHVRKLSYQEATGWKRGYGALLEGGIHFIALVSALAESCGRDRPVRVRASFAGRTAGQPERRSHTHLEYADGMAAEVEYAWDERALLHGLMQHSHLRGSSGQAAFESNGLYVVLRAGGRRRLYCPGWRDLMGYRAMTDDFLACLKDPTREPVSSLRRARRDLEIVLAAYAET